VGTITKHAVGALLAGAEIDRTVFGGGVGDGRESGAFVGTIAEWLRLALPARAPVVSLASFDGDSDGGGLGDFGFVHCDGGLIFVRRTRVEAPSYISSQERPAIFIHERRSQIFKGGLGRLLPPALAKLADFGADAPSAVAALAPLALDDPHPQVQQYALKALKCYGAAAREPLHDLDDLAANEGEKDYIRRAADSAANAIREAIRLEAGNAQYRCSRCGPLVQSHAQANTKSACSKSSNSTNKKASASYPYIPPTNPASTPSSGQNSPSSATSSPRHQRANASQPKTTKPDAYRPHRPPQFAFLNSTWKLNSPIVGQKHIGAVAEALRKVLPPPREYLFPNAGAALVAAHP